jgi:hypothetical protein
MWEGIRLGRERGLVSLDLGLSHAEQPGLVRYKSKFATEEGRISLLRWQPCVETDLRAESAERILYQMTHLLTDPHVPDHITRAGSDALYRVFC